MMKPPWHLGVALALAPIMSRPALAQRGREPVLQGAPVIDKVAGPATAVVPGARDVEGTFTPTPGSLARSFVQGRGTIDTASVTDYSVRKHRGVRVLLQPVAAK